MNLLSVKTGMVCFSNDTWISIHTPTRFGGLLWVEPYGRRDMDRGRILFDRQREIVTIERVENLVQAAVEIHEQVRLINYQTEKERTLG